MSSAKISSVYATKYPYLINLFIIINIILCSCPVIGSFNFNNLTIGSYIIGLYSQITEVKRPYYRTKIQHNICNNKQVH